MASRDISCPALLGRALQKAVARFASRCFNAISSLLGQPSDTRRTLLILKRKPARQVGHKSRVLIGLRAQPMMKVADD